MKSILEIKLRILETEFIEAIKRQPDFLMPHYIEIYKERLLPLPPDPVLTKLPAFLTFDFAKRKRSDIFFPRRRPGPVK